MGYSKTAKTPMGLGAKAALLFHPAFPGRAAPVGELACNLHF